MLWLCPYPYPQRPLAQCVSSSPASHMATLETEGALLAHSDAPVDGASSNASGTPLSSQAGNTSGQSGAIITHVREGGWFFEFYLGPRTYVPLFSSQVCVSDSMGCGPPPPGFKGEVHRSSKKADDGRYFAN